jgi:SAP domain
MHHRRRPITLCVHCNAGNSVCSGGKDKPARGQKRQKLSHGQPLDTATAGQHDNGGDHHRDGVSREQAESGDPDSDRIAIQKIGRVVYTTDALSMKALKQLREICKSRMLPVSGNKTELAQRILTSQLGAFAHGSTGP